MICSEWQSTPSRAQTGSLILDSESHTHKFHTLTSSLPQARKFEKSHGSASKTDFNSVSPESGNITRECCRICQTKLISICFHIPRKYTKAALCHPIKSVKRPLKAKDDTPLNNISASLGRLPGCQQFAKKVSANHLGRHLCWPGLRPVDFCQAHSF